MLGPCIGKNLLTTLETDYIQKRGGYLGLFSFEYNLFPKLFNRFLPLHGPVISPNIVFSNIADVLLTEGGPKTSPNVLFLKKRPFLIGLY